jgi:glutathione S-transferase
MTGPLTLYYAPDNASLCVRLALLEMGIPFDTVLVDRSKAGQHDPAYLALNPNGLIPTLVTPHGPIYETAAILLWLSEQHGDALMPSARADALRWLFWLSNTLHPAIRMNFYPDKYIDSDHIPALVHAVRHQLIAHFAHLDTHADWLESRDASLLSVYLTPMIRWATLYGDGPRWFEIDKSPRLAAFARWAEQPPAAHEASLAEGLGPTIFSAPQHPNPPEGSAT